MARAPDELNARKGVDALATLAHRREAGLRAALSRATSAVIEAKASVTACEQAEATLHGAWRDTLNQGGLYARREAVRASVRVEGARAALGEAKARRAAALQHLQQVEAEVQRQHERLHANARKQEKLRELQALLRRAPR
ncbi:hypothetical protein [Pandoraea pnomenusa]|uniref:hypothetical protein n=1 Tax=Pandoraea pnomenusa TaxID=93220 RepID=UPI003340DA9B